MSVDPDVREACRPSSIGGEEPRRPSLHSEGSLVGSQERATHSRRLPGARNVDGSMKDNMSSNMETLPTGHWLHVGLLFPRLRRSRGVCVSASVDRIQDMGVAGDQQNTVRPWRSAEPGSYPQRHLSWPRLFLAFWVISSPNRAS